MHSTCYTLGMPRTATAVVPLADTHLVIRQILEESIVEAHEARKATLQAEGELKAAYGATALPAPAGQGMDGNTAQAAIASDGD